MSVAFIFPGQGGQFVGQGFPWIQKDPALKEVFDMADDLSGRPISKLCFEGPAEELAKTANLQPAVLAVSLAALRLMRASAGEPAFAAGHSLGEFGALCAAGVIDEGQAMALVCKRAVLMEEGAAKNPGTMLAVIGLPPEELEAVCELARNEGQAMALVCKRAVLMEANAAKTPGAMLAVIGLPGEELEAVCELARNEGVVVTANFNTPEQVVISGESRAVSAAGKYIKMKKGRAIPLAVSGGFHSQLMAEAAGAFAAELEKVEFKAPLCPVLPNATGRPVSDPAEIKKQLMNQITSPVLWTETVKNLVEAGVDAFVEAWPKAYLGSMVKKCLPKDTDITISFQE